MKGVKVYRHSARTGGEQSFKPSTPYTPKPYPQVRAAAARALLVVMALAVMAGIAWLALDAARTATP